MVKNISQKRSIEACRRQKPLLVMLIFIGLLCVSLVFAGEGDYIDSFPTGGTGTRGIANNGTNLFVASGGPNIILMYEIDGNGLKNFSVADPAPAYLEGTTTDNSNIWVLDRNGNVVFKYGMNGGYVNNFSTTGSATGNAGITTNGTFIWISNYLDDEVYKYEMDGTYVDSWDTSTQSGDSNGVAVYGENIWIADHSDDRVYKYWMNGTYISNFSISGHGTESVDITTNGTYIWTVDATAAIVYRYEGIEGLGLATINLISPSNDSSFSTVNFNFTANYSLTGTFNFTNVTYYIWNLTSKEIFNNSVTVDITGTSNETTENVAGFVLGNYEWNVYACWTNAAFTNCSFAPANYSFDIVRFSVTGESYNNQTIEGSLETFLINITTASGYSLVAASLNYGSTNYLGTLNNLGGGIYEISRDLIIPDINSSISNTFYWVLLFEDEFLTNTTFHNQSVLNMSIDNCLIYTNIIYNFTIVDEEDQDSIASNNSIEILVNVYSIDRSISILNYSGSFNESSINICISRNLSNFTSTHLLDSTIKYSAQDHEIEYYNIDDYPLTNQSVSQNITLYDLLSSDSTEFQLTFTGSDFLAVENALVFVKRQYISENVFKTVELPKTDSNGQTILHLVKNDVIYNLEMMKGGVVIGSFENIIAFCEDVVIGDCKIILSAAIAGVPVFSYDDDLGITYTGPTYNNETRIITFNFLTIDSSVKTVSMNATRNDIFGNRSVCSAFVVSSGGTLTCEVPPHIEDSTIITKVFVNGIEILKDYTVLSKFNYGKAGYFIFFIYMLAFILMFSKSKTTMLIGIIVGFLVGITFGLISGRLMGIGASGIWLIVVIILMVRKLNKERPD